MDSAALFLHGVKYLPQEINLSSVAFNVVSDRLVLSN